MLGKYVLINKQPVPCQDVALWGRVFKEMAPHVGDDTIGDIRISTVFLGIDHQYWSGPPILFETMVFGGPDDQYQERYATWEEAETRHREIVRLVSDGRRLDASGLGAEPVGG